MDHGFPIRGITAVWEAPLAEVGRRGWSPRLVGPQGDGVSTANESILAGYNTAR